MSQPEQQPTQPVDQLPPALAGRSLARPIVEQLRRRRPALFLDFDGTLSPIVERPEQAQLPPATRRAMERLLGQIPLAVISGRAVDDVHQRVGLSGVTYAGSHGFRVLRVDGERVTHSAGERAARAVEQAAATLHQRLGHIPGLQLEQKDVALAVHVRRVAAEAHAAVEQQSRAVAAEHEGVLRLSSGKMIYELRPDVDWDKGRATLWLLEQLERPAEDYLPLYIGDDTTDEDAFCALAERGLGIVVRDGEPRRSAARLALDSPDEVRRFLEALARQLEQR